jgi:hypothetical protein
MDRGVAGKEPDTSSSMAKPGCQQHDRIVKANYQSLSGSAPLV